MNQLGKNTKGYLRVGLHLFLRSARVVHELRSQRVDASRFTRTLMFLKMHANRTVQIRERIL